MPDDPDHDPTFRKFVRGYARISGRPVYGTNIRCSCGWTERTNENTREATRIHRAHVKQCLSSKPSPPSSPAT